MGETGSRKNRSSKHARGKRRATGRKLPEALRAHCIKAGEIRNPTGANGWTKARELVRETLAANADQLVDRLVEFAAAGAPEALKMALGPLMPLVEQKLQHEHSGAVTLRWEGEEPKKEA